MTQEFTNLKISNIAYKDHSRIDPSDNKDTTFNLYSFSAHDEGKEPDIEIGSEIGSSKYEVPDNCVLVTKLNPRIQRVWKINQSGDNAICSTEFVILKPKDEEMLDYLYMILSSDEFFNKMERITGGTSGSHQRVSQSDILEYEFTAPNTKAGRKRTSDLINNIDRKIELNRELAELLEETAHAIYESWFEAYEPYDIPDGQDYPELFAEKSLSQIATIEPGNSPESDYYNEEKIGSPFYQGNADMGNFYPNISTWTSEKTKESDKGEILMTVRAPVGNINRNHRDAVIGRGIAGLDMKDDTNAYLYHLLKSEREGIERMGTGTTYESVSSDDLRDYEVTCPRQNEIQEFNEKIEYFHTQILRKEEENSLLKQLRDYLLPQLLSGEVVIQDDEREPEQEESSSD